MRSRRSLRAVMFMCTQVIAYVILVVPIRLYFQAQKKLPGNIDQLLPGTLIISNHQSKIDPFYILAHLPFRSFLRLLPIRFPVLNEHYYGSYYNPKLFPVLTMLGCFPVGVGQVDRTKTMFYIRELLEWRFTVLIFPEGKLVSEAALAEFQGGVNFFAADAVRVLLVRVDGLHVARRPVESGRRVHKVIFSEVISEERQGFANQIREHIANLS